MKHCGNYVYFTMWNQIIFWITLSSSSIITDRSTCYLFCCIFIVTIPSLMKWTQLMSPEPSKICHFKELLWLLYSSKIAQRQLLCDSLPYQTQSSLPVGLSCRWCPLVLIPPQPGARSRLGCLEPLKFTSRIGNTWLKNNHQEHSWNCNFFFLNNFPFLFLPSPSLFTEWQMRK